VLAIGIVVDDAIVVVENVERWIEHGMSPRDATYRAMTEVTPAVIAIAFGLSAVFIPVAFISGITGTVLPPVRADDLDLDAAVGVQLADAQSRAGRAAAASRSTGKPDWFQRIMNFLFGWFFRLFNRTLEIGTNGYVAITRRAVRIAIIPLLVYAGLAFLGYLGFQKVPTGFIPVQDQGYLFVNLPVARCRFVRAHLRDHRATHEDGARDYTACATASRSSASRS
jgi:multidrug efflux pump subunit AcrB